MKALLIQLGLNEKEAQLYLVLLEHGTLTAAELAKAANESRTNTYMIIEKLTGLGLVIYDDTPVKRFTATDPKQLQRIVLERQEELKALNAQLRSVLPELTSKYRLSQHKPGVIHREGIAGIRESFDDQTRTGEEVLIFASDVSLENPEAFAVILESLEKRKRKNIHSRMLLHTGGRDYPEIDKWPEKRNMQVRFAGEIPYEGEVAIYGDKCAFTVFVPQAVVTTIINPIIAKTMRTVFENLWQQAKA